MCPCMGKCLWVQVPAKDRGILSPWSWSPRTCSGGIGLGSSVRAVSAISPASWLNFLKWLVNIPSPINISQSWPSKDFPPQLSCSIHVLFSQCLFPCNKIAIPLLGQTKEVMTVRRPWLITIHSWLILQYLRQLFQGMYLLGSKRISVPPATCHVLSGRKQRLSSPGLRSCSLRGISPSLPSLWPEKTCVSVLRLLCSGFFFSACIQMLYSVSQDLLPWKWADPYTEQLLLYKPWPPSYPVICD